MADTNYANRMLKHPQGQFFVRNKKTKRLVPFRGKVHNEDPIFPSRNRIRRYYNEEAKLWRNIPYTPNVNAITHIQPLFKHNVRSLSGTPFWTYVKPYPVKARPFTYANLQNINEYVPEQFIPVAQDPFARSPSRASDPRTPSSISESLSRSSTTSSNGNLGLAFPKVYVFEPTNSFVPSRKQKKKGSRTHSPPPLHMTMENFLNPKQPATKVWNANNLYSNAFQNLSIGAGAPVRNTPSGMITPVVVTQIPVNMPSKGLTRKSKKTFAPMKASYKKN